MALILLAYSKSNFAYGVVHRAIEDDRGIRKMCNGRRIIEPTVVAKVEDAPSQRLCLWCERLRRVP